MPIYSFNGVTPAIETGAYVHPDAVLIGDVFVLAGAFVAPLATMRGDFGRLILGEGANLQEHCCMHGFPGTDTVVEEGGHIGHGSILHGCHVGKSSIIGMNSTILDNAVVGENCIIGAGSVVTANTKIPHDKLALGSPAKVIRALTEDEINWKAQGIKEYQNLAKIYPLEMKEAKASTEIDFDRPRLNLSHYGQKPSNND